VQARIAAAAKTHPRLFLAPGAEVALKAKIDGDQLTLYGAGQLRLVTYLAEP
jgi:hypothetical protein